MHYVLSSPKCEDRLWRPPSVIIKVDLDSFPCVKRAGSEVKLHNQLSVQAENEWSYTTVFLMPLWCGQGELNVYRTNRLLADVFTIA